MLAQRGRWKISPHIRTSTSKYEKRKCKGGLLIWIRSQFWSVKTQNLPKEYPDAGRTQTGSAEWFKGKKELLLSTLSSAPHPRAPSKTAVLEITQQIKAGPRVCFRGDAGAANAIWSLPDFISVIDWNNRRSQTIKQQNYVCARHITPGGEGVGVEGTGGEALFHIWGPTTEALSDSVFLWEHILAAATKDTAGTRFISPIVHRLTAQDWLRLSP